MNKIASEGDKQTDKHSHRHRNLYTESAYKPIQGKYHTMGSLKIDFPFEHSAIMTKIVAILFPRLHHEYRLAD